MIKFSLNFVDPTTGAHTQNIERTWREVRDNIPTYGRREEHMEGYLAEYYFEKKIFRLIENTLFHEFHIGSLSNSTW